MTMHDATPHDSTPRTFGTRPPGVECHARAAAYVVVANSLGEVATVAVSVKRQERLWLPGGGMQAGETPEQTIVRELREELRREVRLRQELPAAIQFFYAGDEDRWYEMTARFFLADFLGELPGEADGPGEHALQWVDPRMRSADFFHACHAWAALQGLPAPKTR